MQRLAKKVLLIGWDAADWKIINHLLDAGHMPTLESLVNQGVMGKLATLEPPFSPILWTSIATGKLADKHGILGFTEPMPDRVGIRPVTSTSRKVKAIWNMLTQQGLKTHVIGWWPSHPAEPINGICISNHFQRAHRSIDKPWPLLPGTVFPPELSPLFAWLRIHPAELTASHILPFVPNAAKIDQDKDKHLESLARIIADAATVHAAATWILDNADWDFLAVYYDAIDHFSHGFMNFHPPKMRGVPEDLFELYKDVVNGGYRFHDMMLGRLLQLAGEDVTILLISDHGFHSDHLRPTMIPKEPAGPAYQHRAYGIFCLKGPHIRQDELIFGASLLDITPTILTLFGLPVGADMDGKPLVQAFEQGIKVDRIPSWEEVPGECGMHPPEFVEDPYDAQQALQQLVELGYIESPNENTQKAIEQATREAQYNLARVYIGSNRYQEATPLLEQLYAEKPDESRFVIRLAHCYKELRQFDQCRNVMQRFREYAIQQERELRKKYGTPKEKGTPAVLPSREVSALPVGPVSQPPAEETVREDNPVMEPGNQKRIALKDNQDDADPAEKDRYEAMRNMRQLHNALLQCALLEGDLLLQENRPAAALKQYKHVEKAVPSHKALYLQIGKAYVKLKRWKDAEQAFRQVLAFDADSHQAHANLANVYLKRKKYDQAIDEALTAIGLVYHAPMAHYYLGKALMRTGEYAHAAEAFEVCLVMNPNLGQARNDLITLYEKRLHQPEHAARQRAFFATEQEVLPPGEKQQSLAVETEQEDQGRPTADVIPVPQSKIKGIAPRAAQAGPPLVIVSGLPRSGTSMMMQMLASGGMPLFTDGIRPADENNPKGYFEHEAVKRLARDASWLKEAKGQAIKVISHLLFALPARHPYKIIFMLRELKEVIRSQQKMAARQGGTPHPSSKSESIPQTTSKGKEAPRNPATFANTYKRHLAKVMRWAEHYHNVEILYLNYADVIRDPLQAAERVNQFLGETLDPVKMTAAVDTTLYRERGPNTPLS